MIFSDSVKYSEKVKTNPLITVRFGVGKIRNNQTVSSTKRFEEFERDYEKIFFILSFHNFCKKVYTFYLESSFHFF